MTSPILDGGGGGGGRSGSLVPRYFTNPQFDAKLAAEVERRILGFEQQREQARADPDLARRLIEHSQRHGQSARPGVVEGMARAGLEADDPVADSIAQEAGRQQVAEGRPDFGEKVNGRDMRGGLMDAAKTFVRGGLTMLEAPFREVGAATTALGETWLDDEQDLGDFMDNYVATGGSRMRKAVQDWREQGVDWRGLPIVGDTVAEIVPDGDEGIPWEGSEQFLGTGWFPGEESGISQEVQQEKQRLSHEGSFLTPGRLIPAGLNKAFGQTVVEPESTTYHAVSGIADFAANIALDPATYVTGGFAKINQAARKFGTTVDDLGPVARRMAESSLIPTPRADVIGENVDEFLRRPEGMAVTEALRDTTNANVIRRGFGGKIDNASAARLADSRGDDEVREALGDVVRQGTVREKPQAYQFTGRHTGKRATAVGALAGERGLPTFDRVRNRTWQTSKIPGVRRNLNGMRLAHYAPQRIMDLNNPRRSADILDNHLRNAKVSDEKANELVDEFMRLDYNDMESAHGVVRRANEEVEGELFERMFARSFLQRREGRRAQKSARQRQLDTTGEMDLSADELEEMSTAAEREAMRSTRQRARELAHVSANKQDEYARAARQYLVDRMGKPILPPDGKEKMVVNGEEFDISGGVAYMLAHARDDAIVLPDHREIRRTAGALAPLWDSPVLGQASRATTDFLHEKVMSRFWKPMTLLRPAYMARVIPEEQARMAADGDASAINHPIRAMAYSFGQKGRAGLVDDDLKNAPEHLAAMSPKFQYDHLGEPASQSQLNGDWILGAARGQDGTPVEGSVEDWATYLGKFAVDPVASRVAGMDLNDAKRAFWDGELSQYREQLVNTMNMRKLRNRNDSDNYIEGLMHALTDGTGGDFQRGVPGNAELMSGISRGQIREVPVSPEAADNAILFDEPEMFRSREVTAQLEEVADEAMPNFLPRPRRSTVGPEDGTGLRDRAVGAGFRMFMNKPSDKFSRSPHFRQSYWSEAERILPYMTRKVQRQTLQRAKKAQLTRGQINRMQRKAARDNDDVIDDINTVDDVAKANALSSTEDLLYDVKQRSQFGEMLRVAAPFAEAWREIMTTWTGLARQNPKMIRRGQQVVDGARSSDPTELFEEGENPAEGDGFFFNENGSEVFCVDEQTEALTRKGWVHHDSLSESDEVLSLDPYTDEMQWAPVEQVNRFDHDGTLIRWSGNVDALTTPNHRWLVEGPSRRAHLPDGPWRREFTDTAWVSRQVSRPVVVSGGSPTGFPSEATHSDEFVELIGWFVTEGCHEGDSYGVTISQSERVNPENVERIQVLMKHFAATGATCTQWATRRGGECTFYFGSGIAESIREAAPRKVLTPEFVTRLTANQADLLLETLIAGDGHVRPNGSRQWFQNDGESVHTFQMLCSMLGIRTRLHWDGKRWMVWVQRSTHLYTTNAEAERYTGTVWCPTVRTGVWLARRNGCTYWTGNSYPGGKMLTRAMGLHGASGGQADIELTGRVTGLNLIGNSIMPGLGPAVTIPASAIIPEDKKTEGVREWLFPFGDPETSSPGAAFNEMLPPWASRLWDAWQADPQKDRVFGNTVVDTARALKASGNYSDPNTGMMTQKQANRLEADAVKYARRLYTIRGLAQTTVPTGPQDRFTVDTPEEEMTFRALMEDYQKELQDNPRDAFDNFVERFGPDVALTTQSKSQQVRERATTTQGLQWERENQDLLDEYPNAAGFFAPDDPDGEFNYNAYLRQLETGARENLTPDEVLRLGNNQLGHLAMDKAEERLGEQADTSEGRAFLSRLRTDMKQRYPGFLTTAGIPEGVDLERQIAEFRKAANDERLHDHPIAQATREWLRVRDTAMSAARSLSDQRVSSFSSAQAARPIRNWMREEAQRIIGEHPEWAPVYDRVFSREMTDEDFEQAPDEEDQDLTLEPDWRIGEDSP